MTNLVETSENGDIIVYYTDSEEEEEEEEESLEPKRKITCLADLFDESCKCVFFLYFNFF